MPLAPIAPTGGRRIAHAFRAGLTALASLLLVTCSENPVAPHHGAFGYLSVRPVFSNSGALFAPLAVDNLKLTVTRPPSTILKTLTLPFPSNTDTVQVTATQIPIDGESENLLVTIELYAGTTLLFTGTQTVTVTAGTTAQPASVPVLYQGPGANVATLTLAPRDTTVLPGAVLNYLVTAADSQQAPLNAFYVGWKASAGTITNTGQFTAPAVRDTVTIVVEAPAPNTTKDSTRVFIVPGPGSVALSGGDGQSALAGAKLAQPLAVLVRGTDNLPLAGVTVAFAAVTGGGSVDSATATTDAQGIARSGATLGATVGAQTFSATVTGIPAVIFTATATAPTGIIAWNGSVSTDWGTAANWTPAFVPGSTNDVSIPGGTPNQPLLTTTANIANLTIANGGTLSLNGGFTFNVTGNVDATGGILVTGGAPTIQLSGAGKTVLGSVANATVTGTISLAGATTVTGNANVSGGTAVLTIGTGTLTVGGSFSTGSGGRLSMQGAGQLTVAGGVTFAGGDETGLLTAGTLTVAGGFTQSASGNANSFQAGGTHTVVLNGTGTQAVNFASAGNVASHFQNLSLQNTAGGVTLASNNYVMGALTAGTGPARTISGAGNTLNLFGTLALSNFTLDNTLLSLTGSTAVTLDTLSFTGYAATATPLTITHPGMAGGFNFYNLSFAVVPTTGFYVSAIDNNNADGVPLTLTLINPAPASPGGRTTTAGGAVINWGGIGLRTWTGATSTDWSVASNWSPAFVPDSVTDVVIPAGPSNLPELSTNATVHGLTVQTGATLTLVDVGLTLNGNLDVQGTLTGCCKEPITMTATATARGTLGSVTLVVNPGAVVTLNGALALPNSDLQVGGELVVGGQTVTGTGTATFSTVSGTGLLTMTNVADRLTMVAVSFDGGNETGHLTAGILSTTSFGQAASFANPASFVANGTHKVTLTGPTAPVTFVTPATSHFQDLDVTGVTGQFSLGGNVTALGQLISTPATGSGPAVTGPAGAVLSAGGANLTATGSNTALTMNGVALALAGGTLTAVNNVAFINQSTTVPQLSISNTGAGGPFTFSNLSFGTTPVGPNGFYLDVIDSDGGANGSLVINMLNPTPPSGGGFVRATGGASVVWPAPQPRTWSGAVSTDWFNPANWTPNGVPNAVDDVTIPVSTPVATLTGAGCVAKSLTVNGQMSLGAFTCQVSGNVTAGGVISSTTGALQLAAASQISGNIPGLIINAPVTVAGATGMGGGNGNITISGAGASLTMNGQTLVTPGSLVVQNGGLLVMTNPADVLTIQANATFDGADESASLTSGVLSVFGDFTQLATSSGASFSASGTHVTNLGGATPTVTFATPGGGATQSRFRSLVWSNGNAGTLTLGSDVFALNGFTYAAGTGSALTGTNRLLAATSFVNGIPGNTLVLNNVHLQITQSSGGPLALDNLTFQNMDPTVTQLGVSHTGAGGPFGFTNLTFSTVPTSGKYLVATDVDGAGTNGAFTVNMFNPSPATAAGLFQGVNGAAVTWPAGGGVIWTGTADANWANPANWTPNRVPTSVDTATITVASPNIATLTANQAVGALNIAGTGQLAMGGFTLTVGGNVSTVSPITGGGTIVMTGPGTVSGSLPALDVNGAVTAAGTVFVTGNLTVAGAGSDFNVGAQAVTVTGGVVTQTSGTITMTNSSGVVQATNGFVFNGGDETGKLTAGVMQSLASFQVGTANGFVASGNHTVQLVGSGLGATPFISFVDPVTSHFQNLDVSAGRLDSLRTNVTVVGQLSGVTAGAPDTIRAAAGVTLSVGSTAVQGLVLDGVPLIISSGPITLFNNVIFSNQSPTATQLTVNSTGAGGPFTLGSLVFQTTPTSGFYLVANDLDGVGSNGALTLNLGSPTPATPSTFTQANNGAVINWPGSLPITWNVNATSSDWNTPTNWNGNVVPSAIDSAIIVPSAFEPVLTTPVAVGALNIAGGNVTVGGQQLLIARTLATTSSGTLTMTDPIDQVDVGGDAFFAGGSTTSLLTAGQLTIGGNFTQLATVSPASFSANCGHFTRFTGSPTISFATPGTGANQSHFGTVGSSQFTNVLTLATSVAAECSTQGPDGWAGTVKGTGTTSLTTTFVSSSGVTFDGAQLVLRDTTGLQSSGQSGITFVNQPSTATQLTVIHPGISAGTYQLSSITFSPLTTGATGAYLSATDFDGAAPTPLLVDVVSNDPGNGPSFQQTANGASIHWPSQPVKWTGAISNDWLNGGNWEVLRQPQPTDSVVIPGGTPFDPVLNTLVVPFQVGALNIAGGTLVMNGHTMNVARGFATTGTGTLTMTNPADVLNVAGNALFNGGSTAGLLTDGQLNVDGNFTQLNATSTASFAPSGNHGVNLLGTAPQTLTFADSLNSFFNNLIVTNVNPVTVASMIHISQSVNLGPAANVTATDLSITGTGLDVAGTAGISSTASLTVGRLYVGGSVSNAGTYAVTSTIFTGAGQTAPATLPYQNVYINGTVTFAAGLTIPGNLVVSLPAAQLTLGGITTVNGGVFVANGNLKLNNFRLEVAGNLNTAGNGTITQQNLGDTLNVAGDALFAGGSTSGLLTNGLLRVNGNFAQTNAGGSATSFAPSGTHQSTLGNAGAHTVSFGTPGTGAAGSHFLNLDVTPATGGLTFLTDAQVDGALQASVGAGAPKILGSGNKLTATQWQILAGLTVDHLQMVLNEGTTALSQTFASVLFQGFPTTTTTETLITANLAGTALAPRQVTFTGTQFQQDFGNFTGTYVRVSSTNAQGINLIMSGSNDPTGGFSRSLATAPATIQYQ